jgi:sialate O-acetylesterase
MSRNLCATLLILLAGAATPAGAAAPAEVKLPALFGDHMVLQRDRPLHIWGMAEPNADVTVSFHNGHGHATSDALGRWSLYLPPEPAGGPFTLTVQGRNTIQLTDILVGDVWISAGQSNMEFPLQPELPGFRGTKNSAAEIAAANYPRMRLMQVPMASAAAPQPDMQPTKWQRCSPASVAGFSAVGYFFGRDLLRTQNVPIGLIQSNIGGTPAEAWTSMDALTSSAALMPVFSARAHMMDQQTTLKLQADQEAAAAEAAKARGETLPPPAWHPNPADWAPAALFNAMIAPLTPFPIRGVIWYQGESNTDAERAPMYQRLFSAMIDDWRAQWKQGNFPFLFVQIANFQSKDEWPVVREAQRRTLDLADTGMAVAIDIGEPGSVHPVDKQDVGYRLSLWARDLAYGDSIEDSGPLFQQAVPENGSMRVWFTHAASGLKAKGGSLEGFEVAGQDGKFVSAQAHVQGDSIVAASSSVPEPVAVRYGWASAPDCNLENGAGLPASPFTSLQVYH